MDERVTLRSHLDRSASHSPLGAAIGEVIEAIATSAIELSALIADGPLAGITGRIGGINTDGDLQKDIDVAADEIMRRALRSAPLGSSSTVHRQRWSSPSTSLSTSSFSTGVRTTPFCLRKACGSRPTRRNSPSPPPIAGTGMRPSVPTSKN